jgi:glucuronide carrier protein
MWGIRAATGLIPAIAGVLAIVIMVIYPLTDRKHAEIVAEIAARREARGSAVPIDPSLSTAAFTVPRGPGTTPPTE